MGAVVFVVATVATAIGALPLATRSAGFRSAGAALAELEEHLGRPHAAAHQRLEDDESDDEIDDENDPNERGAPP